MVVRKRLGERDDDAAYGGSVPRSTVALHGHARCTGDLDV